MGSHNRMVTALVGVTTAMARLGAKETMRDLPL
ncbi:hypothetical protein COLO4_27146 [Corchorus olitorius]|uniref:Uncharacterized protein n=1 Tax=Corchorus olitorius TaxID=93759 RepID=A0A1R3HT04_9ROSI|nr:hypothetical protein COLO4_27146 [Corchorus olitorius]